MAQHAYQTYEYMNKPKHRVGRIVGRILGTLLFLLIAAIIGLVVFLTLTEYKPAAEETLTPTGSAQATLKTGDELSILTWNVGYGALGDNADFFMDGGSHVLTSTPERIAQNIADVKNELTQVDADIMLLQEVDINSDRSNHIDQSRAFYEAFPHMASYFALNYRTAFVPMGIPPYGAIEGGVQTLTSFPVREATRVALPNSYSWPLSPVQLKRCELITRIPVEGSEHELVVINQHPDAYTDEEHHAAQVAEIRKTLEKEAAAGNWVISGGDWNHAFSNIDTASYPLLDEGNWQPGELNVNDFSEGWQFLMDNSAPTSRLLDHPAVNEDGSPSDLPMQYYMIDGFVVSNNVEVLSVETQDLKFKSSDHNPVLLKVTLK